MVLYRLPYRSGGDYYGQVVRRRFEMAAVECEQRDGTRTDRAFRNYGVVGAAAADAILRQPPQYFQVLTRRERHYQHAIGEIRPEQLPCVGRGQPVRRWQPCQDGIRLRQSMRGHRETFSAVEAPLDLADRDLVLLVPATDRRDQAAGVERTDVGHLSRPAHRTPGPFDGAAGQRAHFVARCCDDQATPLLEPHGERLRLDFDDAVAPAHVERCVRLETGFLPDLSRDDEPPGRVQVVIMVSILPLDMA